MPLMLVSRASGFGLLSDLGVRLSDFETGIVIQTQRPCNAPHPTMRAQDRAPRFEIAKFWESFNPRLASDPLRAGTARAPASRLSFAFVEGAVISRQF